MLQALCFEWIWNESIGRAPEFAPKVLEVQIAGENRLKQVNCRNMEIQVTDSKPQKIFTSKKLSRF